MVYAKKIDDVTCWLVDANGNNVHHDGTPAYHPVVLSDPVSLSGFPEYVKSEG